MVFPMKLNLLTDFEVRTFFLDNGQPIGEVLNEQGVIVWTSTLFPKAAKVVEREGRKEIKLDLFYFFCLILSQPDRAELTERDAAFYESRAKSLVELAGGK